MADFDNTNRGAAFPNSNKTESKQADYTGTINVEGVDYFISAWKKSPSGKVKSDWFSLSVTKKDPNYKKKQDSESNTATQNEATNTGDEYEMKEGDDLPF